ncbi:MAG: 3'(2'),5'-bisphosphate nucleotidase CysQ [Burkholderiales bacterium]
MTPTDPILKEMLAELLPRTISLAKDAGAAIMAIYANPIEVLSKPDASFLTEADLASHHIISEGLAKITPGWPVLSEESSEISFEQRKDWKIYWLIDPLDGTREFVNRNGEFTVNIALVEDGFPVLGVVYAPAIDRLYHASRGCGAILEAAGKSSGMAASGHEGKIRVVASRSHRGEKLDAFLEKIGDHECLSMGSSLKFCLVAEGAADLYPRLGPTMEWDTAAAQCIVEEAGGAVTDLAGNRLRYNKPDLHNPEFMVAGNLPFPWRDLLAEAFAVQGKTDAI